MIALQLPVSARVEKGLKRCQFEKNVRRIAWLETLHECPGVQRSANLDFRNALSRV